MPGFLVGVTSFVAVVVGVGFLIFIHELGHFVLAKLAKVRVEAFSLGFGPAIWKMVRGGTEYRLSAIPLGGYVKMAGENPGEERKGTGDELQSKPALSRFLIFAAGSFMNLMVAFPLCTTAYVFGINESAPVIGAIVPGSAEWASELQVGDLILEVDGKPVRSLKDYHMDVVLRDPDRPVPVLVERAGQRVTVLLTPLGPERFGAQGEVEPRVASLKAGAPAVAGGLQVGDRILAIDAQAVGSYAAVSARIRESAGKPMELRIERETGKGKEPETVVLTLTPREEPFYLLEPADLFLPVVEDVKSGTTSFRFGDSLRRGDRVVAITPVGSPPRRTEVRTWGDLERAIEPLGGLEVVLEVERATERVEVRAAVPQQPGGGPGTLPARHLDTQTVETVPPGTPFAEAGLQPGDLLLSVNGKTASSWRDATVVSPVDKPNPVSVLVQRAGQELTLTLVPVATPRGYLGFSPQSRSVLVQYGFVEACRYGAVQVWRFVESTLVTLKQLVRGRVSFRNLAGPVGIVGMSYKVVERQLTEFLWFLAFISVNLAVVNMLPIPILDGGHILFLFVEKVRGRPVSENVLIGAQYVGLVLILALIVCVTFFDILRTMGKS